MWAVGASVTLKKDRYWWETLCGTVIASIYIYEYVNQLPLNRLLIECAFGAMLLPSIGVTGGKLVRNTLDYWRGRRLNASGAGVPDPVATQEANLR
jgi:hypothetical protein